MSTTLPLSGSSLPDGSTNVQDLVPPCTCSERTLRQSTNTGPTEKAWLKFGPCSGAPWHNYGSVYDVFPEEEDSRYSRQTKVVPTECGSADYWSQNPKVNVWALIDSEYPMAKIWKRQILEEQVELVQYTDEEQEETLLRTRAQSLATCCNESDPLDGTRPHVLFVPVEFPPEERSVQMLRTKHPFYAIRWKLPNTPPVNILQEGLYIGPNEPWDAEIIFAHVKKLCEKAKNEQRRCLQTE